MDYFVYLFVLDVFGEKEFIVGYSFYFKKFSKFSQNFEIMVELSEDLFFFQYLSDGFNILRRLFALFLALHEEGKYFNENFLEFFLLFR